MPRSRWSRSSAVVAFDVFRDSRSTLRTSRASVAARLSARPQPVSFAGDSLASASCGRRALAARPDHDPLDLPCAARLDQLPADRPQRRVRDGAGSRRAQAAERADGRAEQWISREAAVELARVVVEREQEPALRRPSARRTRERAGSRRGADAPRPSARRRAAPSRPRSWPSASASRDPWLEASPRPSKQPA